MQTKYKVWCTLIKTYFQEKRQKAMNKCIMFYVTHYQKIYIFLHLLVLILFNKIFYPAIIFSQDVQLVDGRLVDDRLLDEQMNGPAWVLGNDGFWYHYHADGSVKTYHVGRPIHEQIREELMEQDSDSDSEVKAEITSTECIEINNKFKLIMQQHTNMDDAFFKSILDFSREIIPKDYLCTTEDELRSKNPQILIFMDLLSKSIPINEVNDATNIVYLRASIYTYNTVFVFKWEENNHLIKSIFAETLKTEMKKIIR